jgi:hypothetical protein
MYEKQVIDYVAEDAITEEEPIETYAESVYDANFTIVSYCNPVSYSLNDSYGDGIAKTNCKSYTNPTNIASFNNDKKFLNNHVNITKKITFHDNLKTMNRNVADDIDFRKTLYSEKNPLNFSKNIKNQRKFSQLQMQSVNDVNLECEKNVMKKSENECPLYQYSCALIDSLPGMNSFEFFKFPTNLRRSVQVEVVHLKDLKNAASSTSSETSDLNDSASSEPNNLSHHSDSTNGDMIPSTTVHVQKIGQTSISRESESKTLQTSFGTIIKNTYPPATSRSSSNMSELGKIVEKDQQKLIKVKNDDLNCKKLPVNDLSVKSSSNVKIIACTSQQASDQTKNVTNKNQTLINMLTQQVMMPTNTNRHYIITTATKPSEVKVENNMVTTNSLITNQSILRKAVSNTSGQSQLVQILNSPPSNFTMKSLNVITSTASTPTKPNQVVTVTSPTSVEGLKAELPNSVKQQGIVQFICKTDGKIIHLTPICQNTGGGVTKKITYKVDTSGAKGPTILHHANQQIILNNQLKKGENPNILTIIQKQNDNDKTKCNNKSTLLTIPQTSSSSPMSTRSVYEETYAKFIQTPAVNASDMGLLTISSTPMSNSSTQQSTFIQKIGKTVIQSSNQILPKFNQAFGKSIFSSNTLNEQVKTKVVTNRETITRSIVSSISPVARKNEIKAEGQLLNLIDTESVEKPLPTLQSALQGNNLLYARPIGNGKLITSSNNNVLLTALRNSGNQSNNVRIITSMPESTIPSANRATIMTPVRISVPIQIPQLINSVRPQSPGNFRQQIVIATTTPPTRMQTNVTNLSQTGSKLESLLMTPQSSITTVKHEPEAEMSKVKVEVKQKKNVDNSTLEQLREFDMVLEQVLERSSATPNSVSSPPRPDSANRCSPRKNISNDNKIKIETKSSSVSITSNSPNDSPTSSKSLPGSVVKTAPKLQEDEHTAQRILDILANYKEQVRNSPDLNNKPAPRRRANPPTNPPAAKRKKIVSSTSTGSIKSSKQFGSSSDVMTDTMGSEEDSSCGMGSGVASTGSINNSPRGDIDDHTDVSMDNNFYMEDSKREIALSPQSSSSSIATSPAHNKFSISRRLLMNENKGSSGMDSNSCSSKSVIGTSTQSSASAASSTKTSIAESIERLSAQGSTATAVLMPGNYILPMNVLKSGQQLAILSSNNGQKIIAVPTNQLTAPVVGNASGTSIILQRYVNQINEGGVLSDKSILTHANETNDNQLKPLHLQNSSTLSLVNDKINQKQTALYVKTIDSDGRIKIKQEVDQVETHDASSSNNSFVSDKTLITEIIQQQQQLAQHNHPQQNFMIKLNDQSDSRSTSSIMFVPNTITTIEKNNIDVSGTKIKSEIDFDQCIKEEAIDLNHDGELMNSPMLTTKMEVDENTNSNHASDIDNSQVQKVQQFPLILSSCLSKQPSSSQANRSNTKSFLIDPTNKILMYNDRKPTTIDKEIFNPKSFSEECADLGVDEPIASDLFPEADLLFDSGSPKFDQINPHDNAVHIKRELENGEVLLQMNYNHNITEPWLNFDTEDELVDESGDDAKGSGN